MGKFFDLSDDGIVWRVKEGIKHYDNLEMSGFGADYIVTYGADEEGKLYLVRYCVYPTLRTIPNDTHGSFQLEIENEKIPHIQVNGKSVTEQATQFEINGVLTAYSLVGEGIEVKRIFYPSSKEKCNIEKIKIQNNSKKEIQISLSQADRSIHSYGRGTKGVYIVEVSHDAKSSVSIKVGDTYEFHIYYSARIVNEQLPLLDGEDELNKRKQRIGQFSNQIAMDTGNPVVDTMFRFAKIRAGESVFHTQAGLLHSPGGKNYYAATWCNDQIEYAGPWFAMTGDKYLIEASLNAYRQYIPFMSDAYMSIPSSMIAEGVDIWEGAGDRGDAAMYLYGASLFVLYTGDMAVTNELWPAIKWCATYCLLKKSSEGVIMSDNDELEGRFPTDKKANLSTSSLCYGGLRLAADLAISLGEIELGNTYTKEADKLEVAMEEYFGATLHGYETYRYSKGFDTLRAWICIPICMGIDKRINGTIKAMLSDYLWTEDGLLTCELGEENSSGTIWDRSTLYGFKSAFLSGKGNEIWKAFYSYCERRLLCDRVPYAVEAYPEGDKRHLSGESALFCRIITEGVLGIVPKGANSFSCVPNLPEEMDHLYLTNIQAFNAVFDIFVEKDTYKIQRNGEIVSRGENGKIVTVTFDT
ncbi:MAG: hypothetical protein K0S61_637 [Anaerocolumna sp.]|jgi:hypothetical protein|nr:hypothetical protein [Anaerocolumna sp.]